MLALRKPGEKPPTAFGYAYSATNRKGERLIVYALMPFNMFFRLLQWGGRKLAGIYRWMKYDC